MRAIPPYLRDWTRALGTLEIGRQFQHVAPIRPAPLGDLTLKMLLIGVIDHGSIRHQYRPSALRQKPVSSTMTGSHQAAKHVTQHIASPC